MMSEKWLLPPSTSRPKRAKGEKAKVGPDRQPMTVPNILRQSSLLWDNVPAETEEE